jgi:DinB superfamily
VFKNKYLANVYDYPLTFAFVMKRPKKDEYAPFHATYIHVLPPRGTVQSLLKSTWKETKALIGSLTEDQGNYAYEAGKWTIKQLLIHLIDSERVFAFRALWFMRGDRAPLPGFNQDFWMEYTDVSNRTLKDLMKEFQLVREHTLLLLKQCTEAQSIQTGTASAHKFSVRAQFHIIVGHHLHHLNVYKERYRP